MRSQCGKVLVSTVKTERGYETAVSHPEYNGGLWVVVQLYATLADAECGHDVWYVLMTNPLLLPSELLDVGEKVGDDDKKLFVRKGQKFNRLLNS